MARKTENRAQPIDKHRDTAIADLRKLYAASMEKKDIAVAFRIRKYLNTLLGLHGDDDDASSPEASGEAVAQLELIKASILPLKLTDERYPVAEHVRIAAEIIRNQRLEGVQAAEGAGKEAQRENDTGGAGHRPAAPD